MLRVPQLFAARRSCAVAYSLGARAGRDAQVGARRQRPCLWLYASWVGLAVYASPGLAASGAPSSSDRATAAAAPAAGAAVVPAVLPSLPLAGRPVLPPVAALWRLVWRQPVVRVGLARDLRRSAGAAALLPEVDRVVIGTGEGMAVGLSMRDGRRLWRRRLSAPLETVATPFTPPGQRRPHVLLGARDGMLAALAAQDGAQLWARQVGCDVRAAPRIDGNHLALSGASGAILRLEAATGNVVWSFSRPLPPGLTLEGHSRVALAAGRTFATFADGWVVALADTTGDVLWSRSLASGQGLLADADADPQVVGDQLLVAGHDAGVFSLDVADGRSRWHRPMQGVTHLAADAAGVVVGTADGRLLGLDLAAGAVRWRLQVGSAAISRILLGARHAAFTSGDCGLVVVDRQHGRPLQASPLGVSRPGEPVWAGDSLGVFTTSGYLYLFRAASQATMSPMSATR